MELNKDLWNQRYLDRDMGWDIGHISSPLKAYFDQLNNKELRILIPGCGNAYEAEYLFQQGFKNVTLIDWAQKALDDFQQRNPNLPTDQLICSDFFEHQGQYDLIIEQTFFCALDPKLRPDYVQHMKKLLAKKGKLVGLLFNDKLYSHRPPFGGKKSEYEKLFNPHFSNVSMEIAHNSIPSRQGRELFLQVRNS
jgi:SAM-dependent methyltransferase